MNVQRNVDAEFGRRFTLAFNQSKVCDLSQKELSNRLNVTQQCVSQWRKTFQMKKIALLFDISVEWLYTGRGPMRPIDPSPYLDSVDGDGSGAIPGVDVCRRSDGERSHHPGGSATYDTDCVKRLTPLIRMG